MTKKLNICGVDFNIKSYKEILEGNDLCLGLCDINSNSIKIKTRMNPKKKNEVLMHEAVHGINEVMSLGFSEKTVNTLGIVIIDFIRRNKKFIKRIMEEN